MDPQSAFPENWAPPRELTRALPRETQLTGRGKFMVTMAWLFLIAAIPLYVWMHNQQVQTGEHNELLRTQGKEANAEIVRLWRRDRGRVAMVGYAFTANGGRLTGESSVPSAIWPGIQKAGFLPVRYLPSDPAINHPAAWEANTSPAWMPFVFPAMLAGGGAFLLWNLHRQSLLAAEGTPVVGVVTKCFRIKNGWVVRYQFRMKDGTVASGRDRRDRKLEAGVPVCVLYRPDNPRQNQLYPTCMHRVVTQ
jgi:hypothetical protein